MAVTTLTTVDAIQSHLGYHQHYTEEQMRDAARAATELIQKICNRDLVPTSYRMWKPPKGTAGRSDVLLEDYPLISITRSYSSAKSGGYITGAGQSVTCSVIDGVLYIGSESFTLSSYATMAALKVAVDGGAYILTLDNEGDPQDLRHTRYTGYIELPDTYNQIELLSVKQARIRGNFTFLEYRSGYETIPPGLTSIASRLAVSVLQSGAPAAVSLGSQLDQASVGFDIEGDLAPWNRVKFRTWQGDRDSLQVSPTSRAGWRSIS